ncbi:hypothetical protein LNKW23_24270 [Paralimibaculum aggregatum]|uniref:DUF2946 domain-containing protein n=1 Tax=Paralimibaculum aggregatum TaxID=3036245 RepID=A0ABQ6LLL7_9RHOB|nr:hypothetical protein [Limibaculum sp. NKW23]GMG83214.1 hypothetical protein LNKW23_24270 [Limibaculum sp. NKW23]
MLRLRQSLALGLVVCLLVLRLVAGTALAAPKPAEEGLIALCLGGQIVYVALEGYDGPTEPGPDGGETQAADPCPWMGLGPALADAGLPDLPRPAPAAAARPRLVPPPAPARTGLRAHPPRAPPAA